MIIGIDARKLSETKTGIGFYTMNLLTHVFEIDKLNKYILYSNQKLQNENHWSTYPNVEVEIIGEKLSNNKLMSPFWLNFVIPKYLKKDNVEVFFSPNFFVPLFSKLRMISTIHDLAVYIQPECYPLIYRIYHKMLLSLSIKKNDYILTVSESSRRDIDRLFPNIKSKKRITYCATNPNVFKPRELLDVGTSNLIKHKFNLPEKYILFVGELNKRKNIMAILKSFHSLINNGVLEYQLVLAGKPGFGFEEVEEYIQKHLAGRVVITGYIPDDDLPYIYANSYLFIYPSVYEGFGIPPLEAMSAGIPVISSNISSLPEVVKDAGPLVDPRNTREISQALHDMIKNTEVYSNYKEKTLLNARMFSWKKSAEVFLDCITELKN